MDEITSQPLALTLEIYKDIQRLYLDFLFPFWKTEIDLGHHGILIIALLHKKNPSLFTYFFSYAFRTLINISDPQIFMPLSFFSCFCFQNNFKRKFLIFSSVTFLSIQH